MNMISKILISIISLLGFTSIVHAESVSFYTCTQLQNGQAYGYSIVAYLASGLVQVNHTDLPDFEKVLSTTLTQTKATVRFESSGFSLMVVRNELEPTMIFAAHMKSDASDFAADVDLICQLKSYSKPGTEGPGGITVHN